MHSAIITLSVLRTVSLCKKFAYVKSTASLSKPQESFNQLSIGGVTRLRFKLDLLPFLKDPQTLERYCLIAFIYGLDLSLSQTKVATNLFPPRKDEVTEN